MTATVASLVQQVRWFLRDDPDLDILAVSLTNSSTSITVTDSRFYRPDMRLEIGSESLLVTQLLGDATVKVRRSMWGSTAASYAVSTSVLIDPAFNTTEILAALNAAQAETYPYLYKPVLDTSLTADSLTYEFTVPSTIKSLSHVDLQVTGDPAYRRVDDWTVIRAATPKIKFKRAPVGGTVRLHGFGPFSDFTATTDSTDSLFPANAEHVLVLGAASRLLAAAESGRVRPRDGLTDTRDMTVERGAAISAANQLERRFEKALARVGQPPLPRHVSTVL